MLLQSMQSCCEAAPFCSMLYPMLQESYTSKLALLCLAWGLELDV